MIFNNIYAVERNDFYVHIFGGPNFLNVSEEKGIKIKAMTGVACGVGCGIKYEQLQMELELSYRYNEYEENIPLGFNLFLDKGSLEKFCCMANFYYTFVENIKNSFIDIYFGAGVGFKIDLEEITFVYFDQINFRKEENFLSRHSGLCPQLIIGLKLPMSKTVTSKIEYRFLNDDIYFTHHNFIFDVAKKF